MIQRRISSELVALIKDLYEKGKTVLEIREELKISHPTIISVLKEAGSYVRRRTKIEALKKGDRLLTLYDAGKSIRQISADQSLSPTIITTFLQKSNRDIRQPIRRDYNEGFFAQIDTEAKAYWLGFLLADAHVRIPKPEQGSKKEHRLKLSLSAKDKDHLQLFADTIGKDLHIVPSTRNGKDYVSLYVCSIPIVTDLLALGCVPNKSLILRFPNIRTDLVRHLIRGYLDGDGWITIEEPMNRLRVGFLGTKDFLENTLAHISANTGLPKVSISPRSNIFTMVVGRRAFNHKLFNYFYDGATVFLFRKKAVFEDYLKRAPATPSDDHP